MPKITSVINVHAEGSIARATVESMLAAADYATQRDIPVRTLIVADRPTRETLEAIGEFRGRVLIEQVNIGDPGLARNYAVQRVDTEFISFFDGDDLAGLNWLYQAYKTAMLDSTNIVHPHYCIHFGKFEHITEIVPMDGAFRKTYLVFANCFPPHNLCHSSIHRCVRYRKSDLAGGFGYEDWAWNRDTIQAGYTHAIAKNTVIFYRRKRFNSLNHDSAAQECLPLPSPRFFSKQGENDVISVATHRDRLIAAHADAESPYYERAETESGLAPFWSDASRFLLLFGQLDLSNVIDFACGRGRHTAQFIDRAGMVTLIDANAANIHACRRRFEGSHNVQCEIGTTRLNSCRTGEYSAFLSYDALVHFEALDVIELLGEIARVLRPGGRALLHYSNYQDNPTGSFDDSPHWRNFFSEKMMLHFGSRVGLRTIESMTFPWSDETVSDALTLFERTQ